MTTTSSSIPPAWTSGRGCCAMERRIPSWHVQERWTRVDHNTMKVSMTIDDPKMYTKAFSLGTYYYRWVPNQKINEWLCVPSETLKYLQEQGDPAGSYPNEPEQRLGGGRRGR